MIPTASSSIDRAKPTRPDGASPEQPPFPPSRGSKRSPLHAHPSSHPTQPSRPRDKANRLGAVSKLVRATDRPGGASDYRSRLTHRCTRCRCRERVDDAEIHRRARRFLRRTRIPHDAQQHGDHVQPAPERPARAPRERMTHLRIEQRSNEYTSHRIQPILVDDCGLCIPGLPAPLAIPDDAGPMRDARRRVSYPLRQRSARPHSPPHKPVDRAWLRFGASRPDADAPRHRTKRMQHEALQPPTPVQGPTVFAARRRRASHAQRPMALPRTCSRFLRE